MISAQAVATRRGLWGATAVPRTPYGIGRFRPAGERFNDPPRRARASVRTVPHRRRGR